MRATLWFALPATLAGVIVTRLPSPARTPDERIRGVFTSGMDSLAIALDALRTAARATHPDQSSLSAARRRARLAYKSVEGLLEYFDGTAGSMLNGRENEQADGDADLDAEEGAPVPEPLTGFAGIDADFAADGGINVAEVERRALLMARTVRNVRSLAKHVVMDEGHLFDAARLEIVRVATLGLGGFDAADPADRASEAASALRGLRVAMAVGLGDPSGRTYRETDVRFATAIARLDAGDRNDLDAFAFIAEALYPLARAINAERLARGITLPRSVSPWRASSDFIFDRDAFDPQAYAKARTLGNARALVALGRGLFFDPLLSGDGSRSCASCHHPDRAFAEDRARTETFDSAGQGSARNAPTLVNAGLQPALFYDLRVRSLEDQVAVVVASRSEMRGNLDSAAALLSLNVERRRGFAEAFHEPANAPVTAKQIQVALAAYVRTLTTTNSRFDRAIRGDEAAVNANERRGFNVFMGKARCGTCHFAPLFNGTMPPDYWSTPPEVIGVPAKREQAVIDPDLGRAGVDSQPGHRFAFRTPTLRNVALTAPYMHNGVFGTLDDVVEFYDRGGGAGLGIHLPNQTLRREKLGLTVEERRDLVAFLESLTDTVIGARP